MLVSVTLRDGSEGVQSHPKVNEFPSVPEAEGVAVQVEHAGSLPLIC